MFQGAAEIGHDVNIGNTIVYVESSSFRRADRRVPRQLPDRPVDGHLFGREKELHALIQRLRHGQHSAVVGPAGLGKTALAAEAVRIIIGEDDASLKASAFPDGVVLLDLYRLKGRADDTWSSLADAFVGDQYANFPPRRRAELACQNQQALVIIEGAEEADGRDPRAQLTELLGVLDPRSCRLVLTRDSAQVDPATAVKLTKALDVAAACDLFEKNCGVPITPVVRDDVLNLLQGHPLALTWAARLLARGDESPEHLLAGWIQSSLPDLSDPIESRHTLKWLFERSARGLAALERFVLEAAGLLAHTDISLAAITAALGISTDSRQPLKRLVQSGLLRKSATREDYWHFSHVLGYHFSRQESGSDPAIRARLGVWAKSELADILSRGDRAPLPQFLLHVDALLRADSDHSLWQLSEFCLYVAADRITIMGQLDLVMLLLNAITSWVDTLSPDSRNEPKWQKTRGSLHDRLGNLLVTQGDSAGAFAAYTKGLTIAESLAAREPANTAWQRDLWVSHTHIGELLVSQGDCAGAFAAYTKGLTIAGSLAARDPTNTERQRDLGVSHNRIGELLMSQGDSAGALAAYRKGLTIAQLLAACDPANTEWQHDLSVSYTYIGEVQGDSANALTAYRKGLTIAESLAAHDPSNTEWQRDLSVSHDKIGNVLVAQGDSAGALAAYTKGLTIRESLAARDPANTRWQRDLWVSYTRIGDVLVAQGDGAEAAFLKGLTIAELLVARDPANTRWQRDLSVNHNKIGEVLEAQGDGAGALAAYRKALTIRESLAVRDAANTEWQRDLWVSHTKIGEVLEAQGDGVDALAAYRKGRMFAESLAARDPANEQWHRDLAISQDRIGNVLVAQGDGAAGRDAPQGS